MSLPSCQPKYAKIQQLQETADALQIQLDDLQAAIDALEAAEHDHDADYSPIGHDHAGVYSPTPHNHSGVYSPTTHDHSGVYAINGHDHEGLYSDADHIHNPDWVDVHPYYVRIFGGSGSQSIPANTSTVVEFDQVLEGQSVIHNAANYSINVDDDFYFLWLAQVSWLTPDTDLPRIHIQSPTGAIYGINTPQNNDRTTGHVIQAFGIGPGGISGGIGVRLIARHISSGNRSIVLDNSSWLACLPFSREFGGIS